METIIKFVGYVYCVVVNSFNTLRRYLMAIAIEKGWLKSDQARWSNLNNFNLAWDDRTKEIAALIPAGARVIEFGAGRMALKDLLPSGCRYVPTDVVGRPGLAFVYDLNAAYLPELEPHDVAVLGGVLEYVINIPRTVALLSNTCPSVIVAYCVAKGHSKKEKVWRRAKGWSSDLTEDDMEKVFLQHGYWLAEKYSWRETVIFKFSNSKS